MDSFKKGLIYFIVMCVLAIFPFIVYKFCGIEINFFGKLSYFLLILLGIFVGKGLGMYDKVKWFDWVVHFIAGITLVILGAAIANKVVSLSITHILIFSFMFSLASHTLWEIGEFTIDSIFKTNHQRWKVDAKILQSIKQPVGLVDTMLDSIMCTISSAITCIVWLLII